MQNDEIINENSGRERKTQSNRMEFQAVIEALRSLPKNSSLTLHSDSRILIDTMTLWSAGWKANGWIKSNGRPIPNVDQIILLNTLSQDHNITWKWIKAHSGIKYNERCDELCILQRGS